MEGGRSRDLVLGPETQRIADVSRYELCGEKHHRVDWIARRHPSTGQKTNCSNSVT
jgi:hypothetical protein